MTEKKKMEIVFAPGCFDHFDGTQEELDQLIKEIQESAENGTLFEKSKAVSVEDLLEELSEEEVEDLLNAIELADDGEDLDLSSIETPRRTLQ